MVKGNEHEQMFSWSLVCCCSTDYTKKMDRDDYVIVTQHHNSDHLPIQPVLKTNAALWLTSQKPGVVPIASAVDESPPQPECLKPPRGLVETTQFDTWLRKVEIEQMSLGEIAACLAVGTAEFNSNCLMLSKVAPGTVEDVVKYLRENSMLLTASQAKLVFDICFPKISAKSHAPDFIDHHRYNFRTLLVMALHNFCVQPYVCWEDDGDNQCMWSSMTYNGVNLWESGLCEDLDGKSVGEGMMWGPLEGDSVSTDVGEAHEDMDSALYSWKPKQNSCRAGCGFYAGADGYCSLCSIGKGPKYPGGKCPDSVEEARSLLRQDVNNIRKALSAYRYQDRQRVFEKIVQPQFYGEFLASLLTARKKMIFYLPIQMQGMTILREEEGNAFVADDTMLKSGRAGISFRKSKDVDDRVRGLVLPFGSSMRGKNEGDGWISFEDVFAPTTENRSEYGDTKSEK